jgi:succinyl-CoA synthetase alpha subunit
VTSHYRIVADTYHDSVQLMRIATEVAESMPVTTAEAVMGTPTNRQTLVDSGQLSSSQLDDVTNDDLILAATAPEAADAEAAVTEMADALSRQEVDQRSAERADHGPKSIRKARTEASIALISVPGEYAAREAWNALHEGMHVHIFSDNVSIDAERELKQYGHDEELLVMGPDCGTAIIDGLPLGFANELPDGPVGIVSASGTGLQAVACRLARRGGGVSQAIGTGGRDLSEQVRGLTTRTALRRLEDDEATSVIVLLSKPPASAALDAIDEEIATCDTPVITHFQGVESALDTARGSETLAAAADSALDAAGIDPRPIESTIDRSALDAAIETLPSTARWVRGLFAGGTLCTEAALELSNHVGTISSNVGIGDTVTEPRSPAGHAVVDFGTDDLTARRPHPMIDPTVRNESLAETLREETVGIVLLDVVLGHGAHDDPAGAVADVITAADTDTIVIASVCGTADDPQNRATQIRTLEAAGVHVADSNASAARLAATAAERLASARPEGESP